MDAGITISAAIIAASIVGSFVLAGFLIYGRRDSSSNDKDPADLVRLAEEKAKAESELASARVNLETTQQQLDASRQFEIRNARLETDLENEKALQKRTAEELQTTSSPPRPAPIRTPETNC